MADSLETFLEALSRNANHPPREHLAHQLAKEAADRARLLSSDAAFQRAVSSSPASAAIIARVAQKVRGQKPGTAANTEGNARDRSDTQGLLARYRDLALQHHVDPGETGLTPLMPVLCDIAKAYADYFKHYGHKPTPEQKAILTQLQHEWDAKWAYLRHRWTVIMGTDLDLRQWPALEVLDYKRGPIPLRPAWTRQLYAAEALRMGHTAATSAPSQQDIASGTPPPVTSGGSPQPSLQDSGSESPSADCSTCDTDALYTLAGGHKPRQPTPGEDRFSFPGRLGRHESIFYDYSLIIPVDDCGPCANEVVGPAPRPLTAMKILVGKAKSILAFLDDTGLSGALGFYPSPGPRTVAQDIDALLADVLAIDALTSVTAVRAARSRLREMGALMRMTSRLEPFLGDLGSTDPRQFATALDQALLSFPRFARHNKYMPRWGSQTENPSEVGPTLYINEDSGYFPPDAYANDRQWPWSNRWEYDFDDQIGSLKRYLTYLGGQFHDRLKAVIDSAQPLLNAVKSLTSKYDQFRVDFERLAGGVVNSALTTLAQVLEQLAELAPLRQSTPAEGSKRLGLQVIFRQYWHPDGYVMGKLVGYKNLLPNQKDTLKRRTFIKTARELTTTQEFAATRQNDFSQSRKETAEVVEELANDFNLTTNASGHYQIAMLAGDVSLGLSNTLRLASKSTQNIVSEAAMKGSSSYSEKREVKIRELRETEDVQEIVTETHNSNQEITANYFYYQLLRQYNVTIGLHDLRPVLLRTREVPTAAEIDENFVSKNIHILITRLPAQLSADAQETADELEPLARAMLRRRADMDQRAVELELFRKSPAPQATSPEDEAEANRWREEMRSKERLLNDARQTFVDAEESYLHARTRMDRVITHLRSNICHYMQFLWQDSPKVDQDTIIREETFCGKLLPSVTRGLIRQGYYGSEEVFDYTGQSVALLDLILSNLTPGSELAGLSPQEFKETSLYQYLERYYSHDSEALLAKLQSLAFVTDPVPEEEILNSRSVQIPQDALVVEAMPGQIPLLEGFQMAHRILDVTRACLENRHLEERIEDRPWKERGDDDYSVRRYEGQVPPQREVTEDK